MFFIYEDIPLYTLLAVLNKLVVSVNVLLVFLDPVSTKVCENIIRTMLIHHVIIESMFCSEIFALITTSTFTVTRFNWTERADTVGKEDVLLKSLFTVMSSMFESCVALNHLTCAGFKAALFTFEICIYWGCPCTSYLNWAIQLWNHISVGVNGFICSFLNHCRVWSLGSQEIFLTLLLWLQLWLSPGHLVVAGWQLQGRLIPSFLPLLAAAGVSGPS